MPWLVCTDSNAQVLPSYYIKQKSNGLQSNIVYNIHTAKNGLIYIAHSKGISSFDGNYFKNYPNKNFPYTELSNIMESEKGEIFCKSFNNVLYKIKGDSTEMVAFYPSDYGYMISTYYDNTIISMSRDTIIFFNTNTYSTVKKNILEVKRTEWLTDYVFGSYAPINGEFYLFFVDKKFNICKIKPSEKYRGNSHFSQGQGFLAKDKSIEKIYNINQDRVLSIKAKNPNTIVNYITIVDSAVWICTTNGLYTYKLKEGETTLTYLLEGFNITDVNKTFENNFVISTIEKGLIQIPSFKINYLPNVPNDISVISGDEENLVLGNKRGEIYTYNINKNESSPLYAIKNKRPFNFLHKKKFSQQLVNSTSLNSGVNNSNQEIFIIKDYTYFDKYLVLATNIGVYVYSEQPITSWLKNYIVPDDNSQSNFKRLSFFDEYVATIKYDEVHDKFFINTYSGIFEMANNYKKPKILPEPNCVLKDMACYNGILYLASKDQGIITWDGKQYKPLEKNNPTTDILLKFETYENELWVLGENAIYCYTPSSFKKYDKKFGVDLDQALNMYVNSNTVFINNGNSILSFPKNIYTTSIPNPRFIIHSIQSRKQKENIAQNAVLKYDDNMLNINFSLISFANADNTHLAYSINNIDTLHIQNSIRDIALNNLTPDNYTIRFFIVSDQVISQNPIYEFRFRISPPFYKTALFNLLLIIVTMGIAYAIFKTTLNRWKKNSLLAESKLLLEKELDKSMLSSIKAQMNPHFLFNALNTIQSYIYMNDKQNAGIYISKFSDLTRSILEMSNKESISLEEEINSLKLYLELEKMRFEDSFNYKISVSQNINKEQIKIPSMLVQPYVENAIKHGLLHKKTNRELLLDFTKVENYLVVTIDDNGIGRKRSEELNKIKNRQHTSFAMNANKKRIDILKNTFKEISFEIIDKVSDLGESTGTKVVIKLPV